MPCQDLNFYSLAPESMFLTAGLFTSQEKKVKAELTDTLYVLPAASINIFACH